MARRRWEFDLEDGHHVVEFRHGYFLGTRTFVVDGVRTKEAGRAFMDHSGRYPVPLGGHRAEVWIATNGFTYSYDLVLDGRSVSSGVQPKPPRPPVGTPRQSQILGAALLLGAIPLIWFGYKSAWDEYRLQATGVTTASVVENKSTGSSRSGTVYYLSYAFVDESGISWNGRDTVSRSTYDSARLGTRFSVVYVPADPRVNRFAGRDNLTAAVGLPIAAVAGLALGLYLMWAAGRRLRVLRRVAQVGESVTGTVTKLKRGYVRGIGQTITVEYEYDDPFGNRRRGRGPLMYPQEGMTYKIGGSVRVLVDPDRPGDSVLA